MAAQTFAAELPSVGAARRFVLAQVEALAENVREDAALLVTELTTNAITHAGTKFSVHVTVEDAILRVEVRDSGSGHPKLRQASPQDRGGRGLLIVRELSSSWGVRQLSNGKATWFTLELDGASGR